MSDGKNNRGLSRCSQVELVIIVAVMLIALPALALESHVTVTKILWREIDAFKLSDGRCDAIVVPKLGGRIVSFGLTGGFNFIYAGEPGAEKREPTLYWGGDKTYIGPHTLWKLTQPRSWPPPAPDAQEHTAEILDGGRLRTVSPPWESYDGARVTREYGFTENGDFVVTHSVAPVRSSRMIGAVWAIAQTAPTDAVFVSLNPISPYKDNFYWFDFAKPKDKKGAMVLSPSLLQIKPKTGEGFKLGAHPSRPALMSVKDETAFVLAADPQKGEYPEGADGAGLSVEVYHHSEAAPNEYIELEFLSPLRSLNHGATLTTRWSIQTISKDATAAEIERVMKQ